MFTIHACLKKACGPPLSSLLSIKWPSPTNSWACSRSIRAQVLIELAPTRHVRSANMTTKVFLTLCVVFVMGLATSAYAQLVAGSPEDAAYTKIVGEDNPDAKTSLLLDFEKQFPQSKVLPDIYVMLMGIYQQKNDTGKANDFGEKAIKIDAENITALLAVSRNYSIEHKNLDKAVQY